MYKILYMVFLWVLMYFAHTKIMKLPRFQLKKNVLNSIVGEKRYYVKVSIIYVFFAYCIIKNYNEMLFCYYGTAIALLFFLSIIDFQTHIIPDIITLPSIVVFAVWKILIESQILHTLYGFLFGGLVSYILILFSMMIFKMVGMGGGDLKLNALIGIIVGFPVVAYSMLYGFALAGIVIIGLVSMRLIKIGGKNFIPYGPFFCIGAVITMLCS